MILVIAISVIYFVIQNYKDNKFAEEASKQDQRNAQDQQANKTKLEAEKDKVDPLVNSMQNHTATKAETTEKTESPF